MTMKQYQRLQDAKKEGNMELHAQILNESYGEDSTVIDVEIEACSDEDILDSLAAGLSAKEVADQHNVSVQKVGAVKRKAK